VKDDLVRLRLLRLNLNNSRQKNLGDLRMFGSTLNEFFLLFLGNIEDRKQNNFFIIKEQFLG